MFGAADMTITGVRERHRVRVWFGAHAIVDHIAEPALEPGMKHRQQRRRMLARWFQRLDNAFRSWQHEERW